MLVSFEGRIDEPGMPPPRTWVLALDPTDADVAELTGLAERRIAAARRASTTVLLQEAEGAAGAKHDPDEDELLERIDLMRSWSYLQRWVLWSLPRQQLHVIARRFGLDGQPPATLRSLSQDLGMSREAIRRLQVRALETLGREISEARWQAAPRLVS